MLKSSSFRALRGFFPCPPSHHEKTIPAIALLLGVALQGTAGASDGVSPPVPATLVAARQLIQRVLPQQAETFVCELIPAVNGCDVLEIEAESGKIVLRGNSGLSVAMAFNWYLRHEAKTNFDWQAVCPFKSRGSFHHPLPKSIRNAPPASDFSSTTAPMATRCRGGIGNNGSGSSTGWR